MQLFGKLCGDGGAYRSSDLIPYSLAALSTALS